MHSHQHPTDKLIHLIDLPKDDATDRSDRLLADEADARQTPSEQDVTESDHGTPIEPPD